MLCRAARNWQPRVVASVRGVSGAAGGSPRVALDERAKRLLDTHGHALLMPSPAKYKAASRGAFDRYETVSTVAVGALTVAAAFYASMPDKPRVMPTKSTPAGHVVSESVPSDNGGHAIAAVDTAISTTATTALPVEDAASDSVTTTENIAVPESTLAAQSTEVAVSDSAATRVQAPVTPTKTTTQPPVSQPVVAPAPPATPHNLIVSRYVLVGGGTATYSAMKTILEREPDADILIVASEPRAPYMRPPLSKELWSSGDSAASQDATSLKFRDWGGTERDIFYQSPESYSAVDGSMTPAAINGLGTARPKLITGQTASSLDVEAQVLTLSPSGHKVKYSKLLLATGGSPKQLPVLRDATSHDRRLAAQISTFRSIDDYKALESKVSNGGAQHIVVVGGGFLGSELSCALARRGKQSGTQVSQLFPEHGNMAKVLPEYLSRWTMEHVAKEGVTSLPNKHILGASRGADGKVELALSDGSTLAADHVLVAVGIEPNVQLGAAAGLEVDAKNGGLMVNAELEARTNLFVAGDTCSYHDIVLGRRRVEHHDHAILSGRTAGRNMMGGHKAYKHQSMFWSDLGPHIGYEAVGVLDSSLKTISVWAKAAAEDTPAAATSANPYRAVEPSRDAPTPTDVQQQSPTGGNNTVDNSNSNTRNSSEAAHYGKGVVFYLRDDGVVVGVLLWNLFHRTAVARRVISERSKVDDLPALARMFNIHQS